MAYDYLLALVGGSFIGLAAVLLMASQGTIMGASGILSRLLPPQSDTQPWRASFLAGMLLAPLIAVIVSGRRAEITITDNIPLLLIAGLLVGVGTVVGNGCTSGHGVCGLPRLSIRSIVATLVFFAVATVTVYVKNHVVGA